MKFAFPISGRDFRLSIPHIVLVALFFGMLAWRVYADPHSAVTLIGMILLMGIAWFSYPFVAGVTTRRLYSQTANEPPLKVIDKNYPSLLAVFTALMLLYGITTLVIMALFGHSWVEYFNYREAHLVDKFDFIAEGTLAVGLLLLLAHELPPLLFPLGVMALFSPDSGHIFAVTWASLAAIGIVFYPGIRLGLWLPRAAVYAENFRASLTWAWREGGKRWSELAIAFFDSLGYAMVLYPLVGILLWTGSTTLLRFSIGRWPLSVPLGVGMLILLFAVPALTGVHFLKRRVAILENIDHAGAPRQVQSAIHLLLRVLLVLALPAAIPLFAFVLQQPMRIIAALMVIAAWKLVPWLLRVYEGKDGERA